MLLSLAVPWDSSLTNAEHSLILYFLAVACAGSLFGVVRAWVTRSEVGSRYRMAVVSQIGILLSTTVASVVVVVAFVSGYTQIDDRWIPVIGAIMPIVPRYVAWSIAFPLLTLGLLTVTTLVGSVARAAGRWAVSGAFLTVFAAFLGAIVIADGGSVTWLIIFGSISCGLGLVTARILITAVRKSRPDLTKETYALLKTATAILLTGCVVYSIAYSMAFFDLSGAGLTAMQIIVCATDIALLLGFGGIIHRIAKLRTAEDVRTGDDVHLESIWISSMKQSDAGLPVTVHIPRSSAVHTPRPQSPTSHAATLQAVESIDHWSDEL